MVSGMGIPEATSTSCEVVSTAGKKQWVRPLVTMIDLEAAKQTNTQISPDSRKRGRI